MCNKPCKAGFVGLVILWQCFNCCVCAKPCKAGFVGLVILWQCFNCFVCAKIPCKAGFLGHIILCEFALTACCVCAKPCKAGLVGLVILCLCHNDAFHGLVVYNLHSRLVQTFSQVLSLYFLPTRVYLGEARREVKRITKLREFRWMQMCCSVCCRLIIGRNNIKLVIFRRQYVIRVLVYHVYFILIVCIYFYQQNVVRRRTNWIFFNYSIFT